MPVLGEKSYAYTELARFQYNDGCVDTDRNFSGTPDYEEIFLMYEVEPNEYVYGLDRNRNDEPDRREDDWEPDYPYDADQGRYHLFGRVDHTWQWGKLRVVPQFKYLYLRLRDREADQDLRFEDQVIPILKVAHPSMSRAMLQAGVQGWGPVPYRLKSRTQKRESFERRSTFITLTNSSRYFGYDLCTIIGFNRDQLDFDDPLQRLREFDEWAFFVRGLVGFTDFGRPL